MKVKKWIYVNVSLIWGFPGGSVVKNLPANEGERGPILRSGRSPGGRNGTPPPVFLCGKLRGQRGLVGLSGTAKS